MTVTVSMGMVVIRLTWLRSVVGSSLLRLKEIAVREVSQDVGGYWI